MSKKLPDGIVDIRGKSYQTVAYRVSAFRQAHPEHSLTTEVIVRDTECVVVCATIADPTGRVIANGHSEEYRKSSQINRTSALENAETSAIGRALAAFGMGGTEFASANEVQNAIQQQADGRREGQSQEDAVDPPAPLTDADWSKLAQLMEATNTNATKMLKALSINVPTLDDLDPAQYAVVIDALERKLAILAKAETNKEAARD